MLDKICEDYGETNSIRNMNLSVRANARLRQFLCLFSIRQRDLFILAALGLDMPVHPIQMNQ